MSNPVSKGEEESMQSSIEQLIPILGTRLGDLASKGTVTPWGLRQLVTDSGWSLHFAEFAAAQSSASLVVGTRGTTTTTGLC